MDWFTVDSLIHCLQTGLLLIIESYAKQLIIGLNKSSSTYRDPISTSSQLIGTGQRLDFGRAGVYNKNLTNGFGYKFITQYG